MGIKFCLHPYYTAFTVNNTGNLLCLLQLALSCWELFFLGQVMLLVLCFEQLGQLDFSCLGQQNQLVLCLHGQISAPSSPSYLAALEKHLAQARGQVGATVRCTALAQNLIWCYVTYVRKCLTLTCFSHQFSYFVFQLCTAYTR